MSVVLNQWVWGLICYTTDNLYIQQEFPRCLRDKRSANAFPEPLHSYLPIMDSLVHRKVGVTTERFPTMITSIGFFSSASSHVFLNRWEIIKGFPTVTIFIGFLSIMCSLVLCKRKATAAGFSTIIKFTGSFSSMSSHVLRQMWALPKSFPTITAFINFSPIWILLHPVREDLMLKAFHTDYIHNDSPLYEFSCAFWGYIWCGKQVNTGYMNRGFLQCEFSHAVWGIIEGFPTVVASIGFSPIM